MTNAADFEAISLDYKGPALRVGAELIEGLKLGEAVALSVLQDRKTLYHELFSGFTLAKFDGSTITV
ncbi:MAG: hypothetical protein JO235_05545 [Chroococcidiopsidaceae cyanobacterium CP_BM_RX_35]|nr:hypothetical protein [Chroococcidiopsidaceae cyanobacterium CP_BM_RX_35]